jgi:hypothetical protein
MTRAFGRSAAALLLLSILAVSVVAQPEGNDADATRRRIARLRSALTRATQDTKTVGERLPALQGDVDRLRQKVMGIEPPRPLPPVKSEEKSTEAPSPLRGPLAGTSPKKKDVTELQFRLPLSRESARQTNLGIVCLKKRIYLLDFESMGDALKKEVERKSPFLKSGGVLKVPEGDYDVEISVTPDFSARAVLKKSSEGETVEDAVRPGSALLRRLADLPSDDNLLQFCVYPDSYDQFLQLRKLAYEKAYEVGWRPMPVGKLITIGDGPGMRQ